MTKYHTVEGDKIVRDGEYETRNGGRVEILGFLDKTKYPIVGKLVDTVFQYRHNGRRKHDKEDLFDLMRTWGKPDEEGCKNADNHIQNQATAALSGLPCEPCKACDYHYVRIVKKPSPDKKVYKLSEMWKVWGWSASDTNIICYGVYYQNLKDAQCSANEDPGTIAITRADATEFFKGQNLDEI